MSETVFDEKVTRQIIDTIEYYENPENLEEVPIDMLRLMYKSSRRYECLY